MQVLCLACSYGARFTDCTLELDVFSTPEGSEGARNPGIFDLFFRAAEHKLRMRSHLGAHGDGLLPADHADHAERSRGMIQDYQFICHNP